MRKTRVYELARELGVESRTLIRALQVDGQVVRSASTTLDAAVVERLQARFAAQRARTVCLNERSPRPPQLPPQTAASPARRREWYRGDKPHGLTLRILEDYVLPRSHSNRPRGADYWIDEVDLARALAARWKACVLDMSVDDMLLWLLVNVEPHNAIELHRLGVRPNEVGWSYEDRSGPTLAQRLTLGSFTVQQVAIEVEGRRLREGK